MSSMRVNIEIILLLIKVKRIFEMIKVQLIISGSHYMYGSKLEEMIQRRLPKFDIFRILLTKLR